MALVLANTSAKWFTGLAVPCWIFLPFFLFFFFTNSYERWKHWESGPEVQVPGLNPFKHCNFVTLCKGMNSILNERSLAESVSRWRGIKFCFFLSSLILLVITCTLESLFQRQNCLKILFYFFFSLSLSTPGKKPWCPPTLRRLRTCWRLSGPCATAPKRTAAARRTSNVSLTDSWTPPAAW